MADQKQYPTRQKWQAQPDDAIKLAALRWFACIIEAEAIQIYATDSTKYEAIEKVMRTCVKQIHDLKKKFSLADESECPPGYVMCRNECAPMCPDIE